MIGAGEQLRAEPTRASGSLIDEPATRPVLRARDSVAVSKNVHWNIHHTAISKGYLIH